MPAQTLDEVYKFFLNEPLTAEEIATLYISELNIVRGKDVVGRLVRDLTNNQGGRFYKAFLMGHPGVGKSTELVRLSSKIAGKFQTISFNASTDLNPVVFQPFDIVYLMMIKVVEATTAKTHQEPSKTLLEQVKNWFATKTQQETQTTTIGAEISAGVGADDKNWLSSILGFFAAIKGEIKYAGGRTEQTTKYQLSQLSSLIELANRLLDECSQILHNATGQQWLFVWDGFERPGVSIKNVELLFLTYRNILQELHTNLIFTIPVSLGFAKSAELLFDSFLIPDTPVFNQNFGKHVEGRNSLQKVLDFRINPSLFETNQSERLIVASGGNLRDLFKLVSEAANIALDRLTLAPSSLTRIMESDVSKAVDKLRDEYRARLGDDLHETTQIPYAEKAKKLMQLYTGEPDAQVPDKVLYFLLRARAVQEFENGKRWFGVHPLVVDILAEQHRIQPVSGVIRGGTE